MSEGLAAVGDSKHNITRGYQLLQWSPLDELSWGLTWLQLVSSTGCTAARQSRWEGQDVPRPPQAEGEEQ